MEENWVGMEARRKTIKTGNKRRRNTAVAVAFFAALAFSTTSDAQVFRVRSRDGEQQITHSMTNATQSFAPVHWDVQNAFFSNGCQIEWTAESFEHERHPNTKADCELSLRLIRGARLARWSVTKNADASNVAAGKTAASVSMASRGRGNAQAELQLRFRHGDLTSLSAGSYQTLITGTISGL